MRILGVIPARFKSVRFPGKALASIEGRPMIQWVWERASKAQGLEEVLVATDDERIANAVRGFGGTVVMTSPDHPSGTDRLLEVADNRGGFDAYINIQGDEPLIDPRQIDRLCGLMGEGQGAFVGTLIKKLDLQRELQNPNVVKVVRDQKGKAIYFSRSPIPYLRQQEDLEKWHDSRGYFKHIGMYGYSAEALDAIRDMPRGILEQAESLEQLRWLEQGMPILLAETDIETKGVDVPEDLEEVLEVLADLKSKG